MKRHALLAIAAAAITNSALAYDNVYMDLGAGYVIPSRNSSTTTDSNSVLYSPTALGTSLFNLPNVNWKNKFSNGYEIDLTVGASIFPNWRGEGEFLYQGMQRKINGSYDWNEINPIGGDVFAEQLGNPISRKTNTMNVYAAMANAYYDFTNGAPWTPFLGGGIGAAWVNASETSANNSLVLVDETRHFVDVVPTIENSPKLSATVFAWQIKAGVIYQYDCNISIVAQYRLFGTSNFHSSRSNIVTNPNIAAATSTFTVPGRSVQGLINNGFDINFRYAI